MTKRVLSLLLTLVMVLSLCVPALAADEFEAEAPAEVVEEAPAAPEAPVEPEAEEPVEEPVVEEAPVEEIAADEPEIASIEADEPYLVALGVVTKEAHYKLEQALEIAKPLKAKVDAGELYGLEEGESDHLFSTFDPAASFNAAYKEAQRNLDGIDGLAVTGDVSQNSVETATADLLKYIPEDDGGEGDPTEEEGVLNEFIVPSLVSTDAMKTEISAILNVDNSLYNSGDWGAFGTTHVKDDSLADMADSILTKAAWKTYYQANFREALAKAIKAAGELGTVVAYKDYAAVMKLFKDARAMVKQAELPTSTDAATLKAAITKANNAVTSYGKDAAAEAAKWVNGITRLSALSDGMAIKAASDLLVNTTGNSFVDKTSYKEFNTKLAAIALYAQSQTLTVKSQKLTLGVDDKGVSNVAITLKRDGTNDSTAYYYAYKIGDEWIDPTGDHAATSAAKPTTVGSWVDDEVQISIAPKKGSSVFPSNKSIVVYFYVDGTKSGYKAANYSSYTVNLKKDDYAGPILKSVTMAYSTMTLTMTTDAEFKANNFDADATTKENPHLQFVMLDSKKNVIFTDWWGNGALNTTSWTYTLTPAEQAKLVAGDYTVEMRVKTEGSEAAVCHDGCSKTITIQALNKDTKTMENMQDAVDIFSGMVKSDWTLNPDNKGSYANYDAAWTRMETNAKTCQDMITKAATLANTVANRKNGNDAADDVTTVKSAYLVPVERNWDDFVDALKAAKAVEDEGYTYQTWGALQVTIDDADVLNNLTPADKNYNDKTVQSKIDAMTKKLNDAVDALTKEQGVDKASLKSAIDAASALKEADYTAESWTAAALADAIKAAQTVYDNKNATQAQVNAAIEALRTAQGKLVKKTPEVPTVPAGWTGFKQNDAGTWYFFKNGVMMKDYWVLDQSKHDLWYHMGSDGTLDTGFQYITDKTQNDGWFMLQTTNDNGMLGAALTGWQSTGSSAGNGYFETKHNGHYCECTWTKAWGDYNFKTGVWGDGQQHVG